MAATERGSVVTYAEFLERRERRCRIAAQLDEQEAQRTIDATPVAVSAVTPPREQDPVRTPPGRIQTPDRNS